MIILQIFQFSQLIHISKCTKFTYVAKFLHVVTEHNYHACLVNLCNAHSAKHAGNLEFF